MCKSDHMSDQIHSFHIPVMGIGHSIDTPIRVAPFGISSVVSLVDDLLLEKLRAYYSEKNHLPFERIPTDLVDGRARRIAAYLDMASALVSKKLAAVRQQPFFEANDKQTYFELLPNESPLKKDYLRFVSLAKGPEHDALAQSLSERMRPGSIDVNIMVKLDRTIYDRNGHPLDDDFSDAKTALRGFAISGLKSSVIFSAGMNPKLFSYLARFRDFYRDAFGEFKKKIVLKVSDFRSAMTQSKFLAKRGLEVSEYRIESGLNCGGHAFPSRGQLLPSILNEFKERWNELTDNVRPLIRGYYDKMKWPYNSSVKAEPVMTVQGGIGTSGEAQRLQDEFGVARTGWGSPFLLVPEATNVDDPTRRLLQQATDDELYLSNASPLGIPFNTLRGTKSHRKTLERINRNAPGSPCPKGFAVTNTEFSERPICVASRQYQKKKLEQIDGMELEEPAKERLRKDVVEKMCICDHLGHGVLVKLGILAEDSAAQAICPGPNIAWFDRTYTLKEMIDHIYGRGPSLVPGHRPHMFAKEIVMNVDYFKSLLDRPYDERRFEELLEYKRNLDHGMNLSLEISRKTAFPDENLVSIGPIVDEQMTRLNRMWDEYLTRTKGCRISAQ